MMVNDRYPLRMTPARTLSVMGLPPKDILRIRQEKANELRNSSRVRSVSDPIDIPKNNTVIATPQSTPQSSPPSYTKDVCVYTKDTAYIDIVGDGNCLFRCISWKVKKDQDDYQVIRDEMAEYVLDHFNEKIYDETIESWAKLSEENHESITDYIEWLVTPGKYGGYFEILLMSLIYQLRIQIFERGVLKYDVSMTPDYDILKLEYINENHYMVIVG